MTSEKLFSCSVFPVSFLLGEVFGIGWVFVLFSLVGRIFCAYFFGPFIKHFLDLLLKNTERDR